ncbi:MAG: hypothetical protein DRP35_06465 [Candidatus Zixiibacteriota bacterium]|nr:MAG: hypothetical protein DRP35_06465 [candidate division Zixibacteria bacterium]
MNKSTKIIIPIIIVAIGAISMFVLFSMKEAPAKREVHVKPKIVTTEVVQLTNIETLVSGYGKVKSSQPIDLVSEVNGTLISGDSDFKPGLSFNRGDLLIKIDDRQIKLKINSQKSELMSALAQMLPEIKQEYPDDYTIWEEFFKNIKFDKNLDRLPETNNEKVKLFLSRFKVYQIYFGIKDLEIELEKHYFYALFDGSILRCNKREGSNVRMGNIIGNVVNLEDYEVEVSVSIDDVNWINNEKIITLNNKEFANKWSGKLERIGSAIDSRTQTLTIYISLDDNFKSMIPEGLFVDAEIPGKIIESAYAIPRKAVYNESYVYLIDNGKLEFRKVNIARYENSYAYIDNGLNDGDTVVVELLQGVASGMPAIPSINTRSERSM